MSDTGVFRITVNDGPTLSYVTMTLRGEACVFPFRVKAQDHEERERSIREGVQATKLRIIQAILDARVEFTR